MNTPKTKEEIVEELVNPFIKKWCGESVGHLLDSDENDGEKLRQELVQALTLQEQAVHERVVEEIKGYKNNYKAGGAHAEANEFGYHLAMDRCLSIVDNAITKIKEYEENT